LTLPIPLSQLINEAVISIEASPQYQLDRRKRQEIYDTLSQSCAGSFTRIRASLAIHTAYRVLPIFLEALPSGSIDDYDEDTREDKRNLQLLGIAHLPEILLTLAEKIARGEVDADSIEVQETLDEADSGVSWGLDDVPIAVEAAATAAQRALLETCGIEPLEDRVAGGDRLSDTELIFVGKGDTAGFAAVASAYRSGALDSQEFYTFWVWWLTIAISEAWEEVIGE